MATFETECAALQAALASGVTTVTYRDRTVTYDSVDGLIQRMQILGCFPGTSGSWQSRGVNPCTSKGFRRCGCSEADE